jgi:hypothetical protein
MQENPATVPQHGNSLLWTRMYDAGENNVIYAGNSSHNVICGSNQGNCNAKQKIPGVCATET